MSSILSQADEGSISELFDKDPLELSDQDIENIIIKLREMRKIFVAEDEAKQARPKGQRGKKAKELDAAQIDLLNF